MKRFAIVGASHRCLSMFVRGLEDMRGKTLEFVGIYDPNRTRCEVFRKEVGDCLTIYSDFDQMMKTEKPDGVIVATTDNAHAEYVVRTLEYGVDVYCEKPLTNTFENCLAIREAEKKSGKKVYVTFNCRFMPYFAKLKELVRSGVIGKIHSINYEYVLNRWHGGDYFKRWHGMMEVSQGMLLHKSTHHFDVINWLLEDEPVSVTAMGLKSFFGNPEMCHAFRCSECDRTAECESFKSQSGPMDKALYFDAEHEDGYIREVYFGVTDKHSELDARIEKHAKGWTVSRMSRVSRTVLRLAVYEMTYMSERVPVRVSINEAIELSKKFDGEKARGFVNGILNAVKNDLVEGAPGKCDGDDKPDTPKDDA